MKIQILLINLFLIMIPLSAQSINLIPTDDLSYGDYVVESYSPGVNKPQGDTMSVCNYTC